MSRTRSSEAGFTLAGLIVIMTIILVTIAYTIPKQWSLAVARDRDTQTLFAMKQYARAIKAFQDKNHAQPTSLDQLKQARTPRLMRGLTGDLIDPLTGKVDWIPIPMTNQAAQQQQQQAASPVPVPGQRTQMVPSMAPPPPPDTGLPQTSTSGPGGFVGPIIGVRPNKRGTSYLTVNGSDSYEQWSYTVIDLQNDMAVQQNALMVK